MKQGYVYILSNRKYGVLYIGVTSKLVQRIHQHKNKNVPGFSQKYNLDKLVYYEIFVHIQQALQREKQLKKWRRERKIDLIDSLNPEWLGQSRALV